LAATRTAADAALRAADQANTMPGVTMAAVCAAYAAAHTHWVADAVQWTAECLAYVETDAPHNVNAAWRGAFAAAKRRLAPLIQVHVPCPTLDQVLAAYARG